MRQQTNLQIPGSAWAWAEPHFMLQLILGVLFGILIYVTQPGETGTSGRLILIPVAGAALGIVSWFYFPVLPLYCLLILAPVCDLFGVKLSLTFLALVTGFRAWRVQNEPTVLCLPAVFFCAWAGASLLWAEKINLEFTGFLFNVVPNMLLAVAIAIHGSQHAIIRKHLLLALTLGAALGSLVLLESWQQGRFFRNVTGRYETLIRPDTFSSWAMICAILALSAAFECTRLPKVGYTLFIPMFALFSVAATLTGTRSAVLGILFGATILVIQTKHVRIGMLIVALAIASLAAIAVWIPGLFDSMFARFGEMSDDQGSERLEIWRTALQSFLDHPLGGVGWDGFALQGTYEGNPLTHNVYLQVMVELGVVGLVLFLSWLWVLVIGTFRSPDRQMLWAVMGALLFQGIFLHQFFYAYFWLVLGLCEAARLEEIGRRYRLSHCPPPAYSRIDSHGAFQVFPRTETVPHDHSPSSRRLRV